MNYPYTQSLFDTEHELFRDSIQRFIATQMEPHVDTWLKNHAVDRDFWLKAGEAGILAVDVPEEYGGPGGDFYHRVIIAEELGYSRAGASMAPALVGDVTTCDLIYHWGSDEQRTQWLPLIAQGKARACLAITEPDTGSDISSIKTTAAKDGVHWVINGAKTYISNAVGADIAMVACKTDPEAGNKGISVIFVETDREGFRLGRSLEKMGSNAAETCELFFDDVRVPESNLMGKLNDGFRILLSSMNMDRFSLALLAHAAATRVFHETLDFVKTRKSFGQPVMAFQNTQFKLADIKTDLRVGRSFLDDIVRDYQANGKLKPELCSMAKLWLTEMEGRVIDQCLQFHGGAGYMDEYMVSRFYTAARLHRIFAGTSEIMRLMIGRSL